MTDPYVRYESRDGAAHVVLDSPHNRNAISTRLLTELAESLERAAEDTSARAVVLTHTGGTFCAGADLKEASTPQEADPVFRSQQMVDAMRGIIGCPKPVIARIDGHVRAGGFGLMGSCDTVFASGKATFALTEARLGLAPAIVSLVVLPHVSSRFAADILLTGRRFAPDEAARAGLITAATDDLDGIVAEHLQTLRQCSPQGLRETKQLLWHDILQSFDERAGDLAAQSARLFGSDEAREGLTAFLSKRQPSWAATE
ncbi:enoyl-CoA hydratase family protein [Tsukamurella sp. 8F]|uniref:enoyl-CoA hydratase family protein n=1 Tax=unclassified Tsukamurella TaxID=2633480 RepID=UPI0023B95AF1|nr:MULTISPECIES: enoyl-CoA hydratase family protein [unclassified Tsukamurella]MDF0532110.1 enoyl-CoA hydratase family protein [Tsukamurella sp. 8J]MDF0589212.1 enoyl-CoA hydratase family protein [Tsukamurella sp. 8F]